MMKTLKLIIWILLIQYFFWVENQEISSPPYIYKAIKWKIKIKKITNRQWSVCAIHIVPLPAPSFWHVFLQRSNMITSLHFQFWLYY